MNARHGLGAALLCAALSAPGALAQPVSAPGCATAELTPQHLYGEWTLVLWPLDGDIAQPASSGTVRFERHPEYDGSVRGTLARAHAGGTARALLSGDADDGEFQLDESEDGVAISAVWNAAVNPADCGRRLQGTRRPAESRPAGEATLNFQLTKAPGWR